MCMKSALLSLAVLAASCAAAESFVLPPQGISPYADTEVSTNVALRALGDGPGRKVLDLSLALLGTPSNCLQVAFGRDADGNGVLDASEAETVYGWRAGRFFVEDVARVTRRGVGEPPSDWVACALESLGLAVMVR